MSQNPDQTNSLPTRIPPSSQSSNSFSAKIAELFLTAGHAFQKLGDLTIKLNAGNIDHEENRWTEQDIDNLRNAITRFAHELDNVSGSLLTRSKRMIRTDVKRRTLQMGAEPGGATMASGSRTTFKPVSQSDPYLVQSTPTFAPNRSNATNNAETNSQGPSTSNISNPTPQPPNLNHSVNGETTLEPQTPSTSGTQPSTSTTLPSTTRPAAVVKRVYMGTGPGSGPMPFRRGPVPIYRSGGQPAQGIRLISGPIAGGPRQRIVMPSGSVQGQQFRVIRQSEFDPHHHHQQQQQQPRTAIRTRAQISAAEGRIHTVPSGGGGFLTEEVVETSPIPMPTTTLRRAVPASTPLTMITRKSAKLEPSDY